jgi:ribosome-associated protein
MTKKKTIKTDKLLQLVMTTLESHKAVNITELDVRELTDIMDYMIVCSATSSRHAKTLADKLREATLAQGIRFYGIEGEEQGEWILIDLIDVVVHIMLPETREFYSLEKLWSVTKKMKEKKSA